MHHASISTINYVIGLIPENPEAEGRTRLQEGTTGREGGTLLCECVSPTACPGCKLQTDQGLPPCSACPPHPTARTIHA